MVNKYEVLISASGTKGDIHPLIGIASELKKRKINIIFQANNYFKSDIEKQGIEFISFGTENEWLAANNDPRMWHPNYDMDAINAEYNLLNEFERSYKFVEDRKNKNIFLISIMSLSGARTAAYKYSIPYAILNFAPAAIFSRQAPPAPLSWKIPRWMPNTLFFKLHFIIHVLKALIFPIPPLHIRKLNSLGKRLHFSLRDVFASGILSNANISVGLFPEWFAKRPDDWPNNLSVVGFPLFSIDTRPDSDRIERFIQEQGSPIVFTMGTGVQNATEMFLLGQKICEILEIPGVFVGGSSNTSQLKNSAMFLHVEYMNFDTHLFQCKAIVHHGGIGTVAQAIKSGIPQLIRPLKIDQPDNADRVRKLDLGDYLLPSNFTPQSAAVRLKELIESTPTNMKLKKLSQALQNITAITTTCDLIEQQLRSLEIPSNESL